MEKVLGTIQVYQKELRCDNTYAGAMYSGDLTYSVEFMDEEWLSYDTLEWYGANVIDGSSQVLDYDFATKKLKVPYGLYQQDGLIYITLRGVSGDVKYSADLLRLNVGLAVNIEKNNVVEDPSWIDTAAEIIEELIKNKYDPVSNELIAEAKRQQEVAKTIQDKVQTQQTQIDTAVSQLGVYEWNGSQIRFKQGDGTWGEWHDVAGDFLTIDDYVNGMIESGEAYSGPASDKGIELHSVKGKTSQKTTNGYQLFDASKVPTKTQGGATVTNNNDGSLTISGSGNVSSDYITMVYYGDSSLLKKGNLNYKYEADTTPIIQVVGCRTKGNANDRAFTLSKGDVVYISDEMLSTIKDIAILIYSNSGVPIKAGTVKPMLYQDGDGTWEQFTGGKPAPNPDYDMPIENVEISEIESVGRNQLRLLDIEPTTIYGVTFTPIFEGGYLKCITVNGTATERISYRLQDKIELKNKSYVLQGCPQGGTTSTYCLICSFYDKSSGSWKDEKYDIGNKLTFNGGNYLTEISILIRKDGVCNNLIFYPMLRNAEDLDTTYEPPKNAIVETSLKLAQDDIYQQGTITRDRKQVVFDGSSDETWTASSNPNTFYITLSDKSTATSNEMLSNRFVKIKKETPIANLENGQMKEDGNNSKIVYFKVDGVSGVDSFKTWLSTHNTVVEYKLATPTTEEFKVPTIPSYYPYTNVFTDNDLTTDIEWRLLPYFDFSSELKEIKDELNNIGDSVRELLAKPEIFSGASEEPPAEWKDGDIYIMYEE